MTEIRAPAALCLALEAVLLAIRLRVATALSEIVAGAIARLLIGGIGCGGALRDVIFGATAIPPAPACA